MIALHGFLGKPGDWDEILPRARFGDVRKPQWSSGIQDLPGGDTSFALPAIADNLNKSAQADVLLGYSMGGRLALHMLTQDSVGKHWRKAIVVSASPGIVSLSERRRRLDHDRRWAERFRMENWASLMHEWDSQPVFEGEPRPRRDELDYDRNELAASLVRGSIGWQEDLRPLLRRLEIPVLWVAGQADAKYAALTQECAGLNRGFQLAILPGAGHRAPWSRTADFQDAVADFLGK